MATYNSKAPASAAQKPPEAAWRPPPPSSPPPPLQRQAERGRAGLDAYGWPHDLSDEQILEQLLELNLERAGAE